MLPEVEAIQRLKNSQMLVAAMPAVEAEIAAAIRRVDVDTMAAVRGNRLSAEEALALCHQRGALMLLQDRLTSTVKAGKPTTKPKE